MAPQGSGDTVESLPVRRLSVRSLVTHSHIAEARDQVAKDQVAKPRPARLALMDNWQFAVRSTCPWRVAGESWSTWTVVVANLYYLAWIRPSSNISYKSNWQQVQYFWCTFVMTFWPLGCETVKPHIVLLTRLLNCATFLLPSLHATQNRCLYIVSSLEKSCTISQNNLICSSKQKTYLFCFFHDIFFFLTQLMILLRPQSDSANHFMTILYFTVSKMLRLQKKDRYAFEILTHSHKNIRVTFLVSVFLH